MNPNFEIKQFEDQSLSHYSYAIASKGEVILIDPSRNPEPYYDFAKKRNAKIIGVIETHPHADFVSSHLEIQGHTHARLYTSKFAEAEYKHTPFNEGDSIILGSVKLKALDTPGHSPDSICIVLEYENRDVAVFTGDTLFIGDCGRPDLRENTGNVTKTRTMLAEDMFHSLRDKLMSLHDQVEVYPAHGAGTLCGKALKNANMSTIGEERIGNWSCSDMDKSDFVNELLSDQPFMPKYFGFNVLLNRIGADSFSESIKRVPRLGSLMNPEGVNTLDQNVIIIDTRPQSDFKSGYIDGSINLQIGGKFETWLGSIIEPEEAFYLLADTESQLDELIERIAKIGYEKKILGAFTTTFGQNEKDSFDLEHFKANHQEYTIVDIRNVNELKEKQIFKNAIHIPLAELRERTNEIGTSKPIIIHCAGGYRSATGSSIVKRLLPNNKVYDLGEAVTTF
ncbi:MAG: MBL fold metallo-hydrolase [Leadbetterella sp.]